MAKPRKPEKRLVRTRLKHYMERDGLSRQDVVYNTGMTYITVMSWEQNALAKIDMSHWYNISTLFGVTFDEFFIFIEPDEDTGTDDA